MKSRAQISTVPANKDFPEAVPVVFHFNESS